MNQILYIRAIIISIVKRYEAIILSVTKFLVGMFIFSRIGELDFAREEFLFLLTPPTSLIFLMLMSFLFAILPLSASYCLIAVYVAVSLSLNIELAVMVLLFFLCVIFFYIRLAPRESVLILLTILCFHFKIPYLVPMLAGLYFGLTSAIPIMIGVFIWSFIPVTINLMTVSTSAGLNIMEMTETIPTIYTGILVSLSSNYQWIFTAFSFTMVMLTVYAISRLSINYSAETAIILSACVNIISFIAAAVAADLNVGIPGMIFSTIVCACLMCVIRFFDIALDYSRAENVQFSDEDNYYYVKVVPRLLSVSTKKKKAVKKPRPTSEKPEF